MMCPYGRPVISVATGLDERDTMPTNVVMPQMGESIAEGTIVRWIKKVGDRVDRDEPLFEISTDKVDAEIPSPASGVLAEIRANEGETVPVESVVAVIAEAEAAVPVPSPVPAPVPAAPSLAVAAPPPVESRAPVSALPSRTPEPASGPLTADELRRQRSSPLVRRIAREHNIDIARLKGSGIGGRVTKQDILSVVEGDAAAIQQARTAAPAAVMPAHAGPAFRPGESVEIVPMTVMRKRIAEHMIASRRTSAHVHSVFEVDFQRVSRIREAKKAEYERLGVKLTYLPFIIKAAADALRAVPVVNSSIDGDNIVYKKDVNIGVAVALDWGLIVPVIRNADEKNILGLSRTAADLAVRARAKQLKPEEVQGGTFTITNPGVFGALLGTPIISQPQVAILGVGAIEKRVVVVDDAIAIRPRGYLTLGYDHRLIDGAVADEFMSFLKKRLEEFDPAGV
jgi:pyruvate dehydrogenase E2 component (dihydrolipoyllysine-residue acetyltransferase)